MSYATRADDDQLFYSMNLQRAIFRFIIDRPPSDEGTLGYPDK